MISWLNLRNRVLRVLDDNIRTDLTKVSFSDDDLLDAINDALINITAHTAQEKVFSTTLTTEATILQLPDDVVDLGPITINDTISIVGAVKVVLGPGESLPTTTVSGQYPYYRWPTSQLNFPSKIPATYTVDIRYWGYWSRVEREEDVLAVDRWMEEPLKWYMLHLLAAKPAYQASVLGQYKIRSDLGKPTDNPLLEFSGYCFKRYDSKMSEYSPQDRSGWEG